jgi:hypothetical protein
MALRMIKLEASRGGKTKNCFASLWRRVSQLGVDEAREFALNAFEALMHLKP